MCDDTDGKVCNNNMRGFDVGDRIQKRNGLSTPHHFVKIDFSKVWVIDMVRARRRPGDYSETLSREKMSRCKMKGCEKSCTNLR